MPAARTATTQYSPTGSGGAHGAGKGRGALSRTLASAAASAGGSKPSQLAKLRPAGACEHRSGHGESPRRVGPYRLPSPQ